MPTREQMDEAVDLIRSALGCGYVRRHGTAYPLGRADAPAGCAAAGHEILRFPALSEREKSDVLDNHVIWEGFTLEQQRGVVRRILAGEGPGAWMSGIEPARPAEALRRLHAEMEAEEQASRLALAGEPDPLTYEQRVAEAYRRRSEWASPGPPAPPAVDEEVAGILDALERDWRDAASPGGVLGRAEARLSVRPREPEGERDR